MKEGRKIHTNFERFVTLNIYYFSLKQNDSDFNICT